MTSSDNDDFLSGLHGLPDKLKLQAMSDIKLYSELEFAKLGTAKYMFLEAEKRRRETLNVQASEPTKAEPNHAAEPSAKPGNNIKHWSDKPLGKIVIGFVIGILVLCAAFIIRQHFSLPI